MTAATQFTPSMQAHAAVLMERSHKWCKGERNADGLPFFLFTSSRTTKDGAPIVHRTRADGGYCSCPSFEFRQACSHALAVRTARDQADELMDEYDDLNFGHCGVCGAARSLSAVMGGTSCPCYAARRTERTAKSGYSALFGED